MALIGNYKTKHVIETKKTVYMQVYRDTKVPYNYTATC